jgi:hypothetical protein
MREEETVVESACGAGTGGKGEGKGKGKTAGAWMIEGTTEEVIGEEVTGNEMIEEEMTREMSMDLSVGEDGHPTAESPTRGEEGSDPDGMKIPSGLTEQRRAHSFSAFSSRRGSTTHWTSGQ